MRRWFATTVLLLVGFVTGAVVTGRLQPHEARTDTPAPAPADAAAPAVVPAEALAAQGGAALPDFTGIAARTAPAIVNISTIQVYRPRFRDPFFDRLFGGHDMFPPQRGTSAGSGVIISPDGYVLTNSHVLGETERLQQVTVILSDKRERQARPVGVDPYTDLALLKIDERNLPTVPWGDSSNLRVAEWVLAIGNPYQLGQTVTLGIVSGVNRSYADVSALVDYIQTDAAINPGNSGGALINRRGELIGINTWIYSESGGDQGIGFAIPSNLARRVAEELIKNGVVRRGSIGDIRLAAVTPALAHDLDLPEPKGALVWSLYRTSPAYRAGLRPGDVVVSVNGKPIDEPAQLQRAVLEAPVGSMLTLGLRRNGELREIRVEVETQSTRRRQSAD